MKAKCVLSSRKNPCPPHGKSLKIPRGGDFKSQNFEAKYEVKLEFLGGREGARQQPSIGGVWMFSGTTQWCSLCSICCAFFFKFAIDLAFNFLSSYNFQVKSFTVQVQIQSSPVYCFGNGIVPCSRTAVISFP